MRRLLLLIFPILLVLSSCMLTHEVSVRERLNDVRSSYRLVELSPDERAQAFARSVAERLVRQDYLSHTSYAGLRQWTQSHGFRGVSEILGHVRSGDYGDLIRAWMASPSHRAAILEARHRVIGVSVVPDSNTPTHVYVAVIMAF